MSEGDSGKWAKITIVLVIAAMVYPIYYFMDSTTTKRVDDAWARAGGRPSAAVRDNSVKDPASAEQLWRDARIYWWTYRPDQCKDILRDWLIRYGGNDADLPPEDHYQPWEGKGGYFWDADNERPDYYPSEPHRLTPKVCVLLGEYWETKKEYARSKHLFDIVVKRFQSDPDSVKRATDGIGRYLSRAF